MESAPEAGSAGGASGSSGGVGRMRSANDACRVSSEAAPRPTYTLLATKTPSACFKRVVRRLVVSGLKASIFSTTRLIIHSGVDAPAVIPTAVPDAPAAPVNLAAEKVGGVSEAE